MKFWIIMLAFHMHALWHVWHEFCVHAYDMHMHAYDMHMHAYNMHMHAYDMYMHAYARQ